MAESTNVMSFGFQGACLSGAGLSGAIKLLTKVSCAHATDALRLALRAPSLSTPAAEGRPSKGRVRQRRLLRCRPCSVLVAGLLVLGILLRKRAVAQGFLEVAGVVIVVARVVVEEEAVVQAVVVVAKPVVVALAGLAILLLREMLRASPISLRRLARVGRRRRPWEVVSALISAVIFRPF